ncbi:MAG: hypothetical protein RLZ98_903 [Pseudomonadota bacterium]
MTDAISQRPPYAAPNDWPPVQAALAVAFILGVAIGLSGVVQMLPSRLPDVAKALIALGVVQAAVLPLVFMAARRGKASAIEVLALDRPLPGARELVTALGGMMLIVVPYTLAVMILSPDTMARDLKPFAQMLRSDWWWLVLIVVGIGAPLMEELLFRGFLQSALARSRIGFAGASLVSTTAWSALHWGYSVAGLIEVFLIGLYFCWLLWRSGSLWVPMLCHGIYNSGLVLILLMMPLAA